MQLNDIIIVSVMVSDAYPITDTDPIPPKIPDTDISIWYRCIPKKDYSEKRCEIQGGGQEMAVMVG